ncbi:MAG: Flp pilus assembly complex ATPase component TadA, partial [Gammaproteobacteria bacterium]|nr:Flp pilus assembly complex ATPase component TadA [Gammaproteobacteria bacterium]
MLSTKLSHHALSANLTGLAACIVRDSLLDIQTAQTSINIAAQQGIPLACYLVRSNTLSSQQLLTCCAKHFDLPIFDLKNYDLTWLNESPINDELIHRHRIIPLNKNQYALYVGLSDPTDHTAISAISFHTGLHVQPMLVDEAELDKILSIYSLSTRLGPQLESTLAKITPIEEKSSPYEMTEQDDGPVSEFIDKLIHDAIDKKVSDIHIEPFNNYCRIRFRHDGLLYEAAVIPPHLAMRIITKLKIMSGLNIAERRLPQDGRLQLQHKSKTDVRINTCPTLFGEKIVLRILDASKIKLDIDVLGFTDIQKKLFISKLNKPQGLILVTGPTGSGKTITLYSALHYLNQIEKNISSVEDPIEIEFSGINQVNINPRIGLDFSAVLRTFLRQDPDIIMVGEIRDRETAAIA